MSRASRIIDSIVENTPEAVGMDPEQARKFALALIATGALSIKAIQSALRKRREMGSRYDYQGAEGYDLGDPTMGLYKKGISSVKSGTNIRKIRKNSRR